MFTGKVVFKIVILVFFILGNNNQYQRKLLLLPGAQETNMQAEAPTVGAGLPPHLLFLLTILSSLSNPLSSGCSSSLDSSSPDPFWLILWDGDVAIIPTVIAAVSGAY